jgi:hypothetical protein
MDWRDIVVLLVLSIFTVFIYEFLKPIGPPLLLGFLFYLVGRLMGARKALSLGGKNNVEA